ncbi:MAG: hypothetical protein KKB51_22370 [Candidatus Riflebacteria bacterium]|nr:hypothetical protein [Candidatus Riflebacteria bacterium]
MTRKPVRSAGTTLVEILVATTILSFTLAPIVAMFVFASRSMGSSVHRIQAQFLAHAVLESIKAEVFRQPKAVDYYPSRFEISPVRRPMGFFARSQINFFNNVHGADKPITPDSPLYAQFSPFRLMVDFSRSKTLADITVTAYWSFEGKAQNLELKGNVELQPYKFIRYERY